MAQNIYPDVVTSGVSTPQNQGVYQPLYDQNPYTNAGMSTSPWQQILHWLGFRTKADAWRENMAVQANEYNAQIAMKQYDEEYNLPINQVARMRAAGINPDLNGGQGISAGEAQQPGQDPSTPMLSEGDEGMIMGVAQGVMSAFSTALGMVQTFQGIQGQKLQNALLSLQGESAFNSFAESVSGMLLPPSPKPDGIQNFDWKSAALSNATAFAGNLPQNLQKRFIDWQSRFWNSAIGESESYEDFRKRISSKRGYEFDSRYFWSEIDDVLGQITEPLASMAEKIFNQSQSSELAEGRAAEEEAIYSEGLNKALDPTAEAGAANATNRNTMNQQSTLGVVTGTINTIMQNLKSSSQKKGIEGALSSIALALISGLYLYVQSGAKISRSSGSSHSVGKNGVSNSQSRGFSLGF